MQVDFSKRRREGAVKFKMFGVVNCARCAQGWKQKLMAKGKKVRVHKAEKGYEVWAT